MVRGYIPWFRNFLMFEEFYFPEDKLGAGDKLILKFLTSQKIELLEECEQEKILGSDLLRLVNDELRKYGFKPREIK